LIIWPTRFQEIWEGSSNFGWYHEQSKDGYLDRNVILKWITETFEPQTKARAKGSIRLLISDALSDYNTRFVEKFCEKENIRLCQLHSLAAQKLQPRHVGPFEHLQTTLQKEFKQAYTRCENSEKALFTVSYNYARRKAFEVHIAQAQLDG
jgi:hypothetical protein